ncbi:Uncharacterised protein [Vibrio cholerae]|nr:Uncharacterised protein [Vibrio cholerae]
MLSSGQPFSSSRCAASKPVRPEPPMQCKATFSPRLSA